MLRIETDIVQKCVSGVVVSVVNKYFDKLF